MISGTVGNFHTDARLFNPSFDKDIQIGATFYPTDGSGALTANVTVPKRQMKIVDDVTTQLFSTTKLGAILFTSGDQFEATSRIYAQTAVGTLGQFGPGTAPSAAKTKGVLLQLKSNGAFRTNVGVVNPNNATANVTWTLYDKNSAVISSKTTPLPPLSTLAPTNIAGGFFFDPKGSDMSDAWISYASDQPILAYASVIDSGTTDRRSSRPSKTTERRRRRLRRPERRRSPSRSEASRSRSRPIRRRSKPVTRSCFTSGWWRVRMDSRSSVRTAT